MSRTEYQLRINSQIEAINPKLHFVEKSIEIARIAHADAPPRISGEPYFNHLLEVAKNPAFPDFSPEEIAVCYLHDTLQKTAVTIRHLITTGIPNDVIRSTIAMTPKYGEKYFDGTERVILDPHAPRPKQSDNMSNMDEDRMPSWYEPSWKMKLNWDFQYPLNIAFIQAVLDEKIPKTSTIASYVKSKHCDSQFKGNPYLQILTSHPI